MGCNSLCPQACAAHSLQSSKVQHCLDLKLWPSQKAWQLGVQVPNFGLIWVGLLEEKHGKKHSPPKTVPMLPSFRVPKRRTGSCPSPFHSVHDKIGLRAWFRSCHPLCWWIQICTWCWAYLWCHKIDRACVCLQDSKIHRSDSWFCLPSHYSSLLEMSATLPLTSASVLQLLKPVLATWLPKAFERLLSWNRVCMSPVKAKTPSKVIALGALRIGTVNR